MKETTSKDNIIVEGIKDRLDKVMSINTLSETEGGKALVAILLKQVVESVEKLMAGYTRLTITEFIALSADMRTKMDLVHEITGAENKEQNIRDELKQELSNE